MSEYHKIFSKKKKTTKKILKYKLPWLIFFGWFGDADDRICMVFFSNKKFSCAKLTYWLVMTKGTTLFASNSFWPPGKCDDDFSSFYLGNFPFVKFCQKVNSIKYLKKSQKLMKIMWKFLLKKHNFKIFLLWKSRDFFLVSKKNSFFQFAIALQLSKLQVQKYQFFLL